MLTKLECVLKGLLNCLHLIPSRKKAFTVLHDVSGIIKPRRYKDGNAFVEFNSW